MRNLSVGSKLVLTCSVILILFIASSITGLFLSESMMNQYAYFYDHPFQISNLSRTIQTDVLSIRIDVKDSILSEDTKRLEATLQSVNEKRSKILSEIAMLRYEYTDDAAHIDTFESDLNQWWVFVEQALQLEREGKQAEAMNVTVNVGPAYADRMLADLDSIIASAYSNATTCYSGALEAHNEWQALGIMFLALTIVLSMVLVVLLTRNIIRPIKAMMGNIDKVETDQPVYDIPTQGRRDELGKLVSAFNRMLTHLKTQREINELNLKLEHHKTLEQFRITLMSIGDAVIATDINGRVTNMNPVAQQLTGWTLDEARGLPVEKVFCIVNSKTHKKAENPLKKVLQTGAVVGLANHTELISRAGAHYNIADSAAPIRDDQGNLFGVVLVFRDVTDDYRKQEEIAHMSFHDKLTGLYNRAFFEEELLRINTARQMPLALIMGDINGLKLINDTFGHQMGDKYLAAAAETIRSCCRAEDVVARWGGDEFVVLLPRTALEESLRICDRIVEGYSRIKGFTITPSIAIGCAVLDTPGGDTQKLLIDAETNMYRHKLLESTSIHSAIVASLDGFLNARDFGTEEHAQSMVNLCAQVGKKMGMSAGKCEELELLGRLHDIGKIAISDDILLKPGPLTYDEWIIMRRHTEIGYRIAKSVPDLEYLAEGILSHHERWDGTGYPRRISGTDIPLNARIVAVADAYDAMTRDRPYKLAVSSEEAIEELKQCAGAQFDPDVVEAFIASIQQGR